jgi:hypothetical protein
MRFNRISRIVLKHSLASLVLAATASLALFVSPAPAAPAGIPTPVQTVLQWHQVANPAPHPATVRPLATCAGYGCDNKDPNTSGCADGSQYTVAWGDVAVRGVVFATINLRYSPTCGTNWAQITNNRTGEIAVLKVCRDQGDRKCSDTFAASATSAWTNQMYAYNITATAYATLYMSTGQAVGQATA